MSITVRSLVLVLMVAAVCALAPAADPVVGNGGPTEPPGLNRGQDIEIVVGACKVVNAPWPVAKRWALTDDSIVKLVTPAGLPNQVVLQGVKPGRTDLVLWDANEKQMYQCQVAVVRSDVGGLLGDLKTLFPDSTLQVTASGEVTVVSGMLTNIDQAEALRSLLNKRLGESKWVDMTTLAGVQQVLLKVRVAEVSRTALRALGINALWTGSDAFGASVVGPSSGVPLVPVSIGPPKGAIAGHGIPFAFNTDTLVSPSVTLFGGFPNTDLEIFVQALAENQYLRVLAEPNLIALSGKEATFLAGGEYPIPVVQSTIGTSTSISIEYRQFGVQLRFRPMVRGDGQIELFVAPEVSELSDTGAVEIQGFSIPSLRTRRASTTVRMNSQQTFAIAGLISRQTSARTSRVPGIGDLPVLGALFRSVRYSAGETELVVLVTASLVEPSYDLAKRPLPGMDHVPPSDWELYFCGRIEGSDVPRLSGADRTAMKECGFAKLRGPALGSS